MQVDIGEKRGDDPALGSAGDRLGHYPVRQHSCCQPPAKELQYPSVRHPLADQRQELVVVDRAEEVLDVGLEDEVAAFDEADPELLHRVERRPLRAEPEGAGEKVGLEDWFEDELGRLLGDPVLHSGNAQRTGPSVGLWDLHPAHRRRVVVTCTEVPGQPVDEASRSVLLHCGERHSVDACRSTIGTDPLPRLPQNVTSVDAVIQGVETPFRMLLGRSP